MRTLHRWQAFGQLFPAPPSVKIAEARGTPPSSSGASSAGLSLIGKIAKSLESILDGPQRDPEDKEQQMAEVTPQQQRVEANLREQAQRTHEADIAKWRQKEMEAYLDQRDKERHIDRGR